MSRHVYTLSHPASWHGEIWKEALPLGNGLTGVLVSGAIGYEKLHFNRHDLWTGSDDSMEIPDVSHAIAKMREYIDRGDYESANNEVVYEALKETDYKAKASAPCPLGYLNMTFEPNGTFRHYRRGVNMRTGEAFVRFEINGCQYERRLFVSRDADMTVMRVCAQHPFTISYKLELFEEANTLITNGNTMELIAKDGDTAMRVAFIGDFRSEQTEDELAVTGTDHTVLIKCASHGSPLSLDEYLNESYNSLFEKHKSLHTPLYDSVNIELADDAEFLKTNEQMLAEAYEDEASPALLERMWRFGRYLFISAANEKGNPVPLYGLWHGAPKLKWNALVANENVQMTYWHALAGGLSYAVLPLLRHYTSHLDVLRSCAKNIFGVNGIWISAYTNPDCCGVTKRTHVIVNWISAAGWLSRHFWEYYLYTGDEELLRREILPFMYEAATFYKEYAVVENGTVRIYPSVSPENTPLNLKNLNTHSLYGHPCPAVQNATMDMAIMKELFKNLLNGIEITGMYADKAAEFREMLEQIPAYQINEDGAVKEWMHPDLQDNYAHRHLSHIYPVFPGNEVSQYSDPKLFEAFKTAVRLRKLNRQCNWSLVHMACIYARFGEAEKAAECMDIMTKSVLLPSLMTLCNDWRGMGLTLNWKSTPIQLDAVFGTVNVIQEMLLFWQKGRLSILPALPARMKAGKVSGLVFPNGKLDIEWDDSEKTSITIYANKHVDVELFVRGEMKSRVILENGEKIILTF